MPRPSTQPWSRRVPACLITAGLLMTTLSLSAPKQAGASESHCYSIQDSDRKNICLAMAKRQESYCYSVRNSDDKNVCLAQVKQQRSYCYSVRSNDVKNQCLAMVR